MKRRLSILLLVAVACLLWTPPATPQYYDRPGQLSQTWNCGFTALGATLTKCIGAVNSNTRMYITDIFAHTTTATAGTYQVRAGTGSNCATNTVPVFPGTVNGDSFAAPTLGNPPTGFSFVTPLRPPQGADICIIGTVTNTINISLNGFSSQF